MRTRSIAPGAARWPQLICAPSKAGPVGLEQATRRSLVAEHDFGVGAHIHQQRHFRGEIRPLGEHHAGRIRADVSRDARQHVDARIAMQLQVDDVGPQGERVIDGERERRAAEFHRIDAEQQVMHDGIADQRRLEDVLVRHAGHARHVRRERAQRLAHRHRHQRGAARIHHGIGDAAHQILAEADLRIHDARGGDHLAAQQDRTDAPRWWSSRRRPRDRRRARAARARRR